MNNQIMKGDTAVEEKVIITSENVFSGRGVRGFLIFLVFLVVIGIAFFLVARFVLIPNMEKEVDRLYDQHCEYGKVYYGSGKYDYNWRNRWDIPEHEQEYENKRDTLGIFVRISRIASMATAGVLLLFLILLIIYLACQKRITVTNKRVYGTAIFNRRIDLPLDSISAVAIRGIILKGIAVATASGRIRFKGIKNRNEVHRVICRLLIERQDRRYLADALRSGSAGEENT